MSIQEIVKNDLVQEKSSVWMLKQHSEFTYSEGAQSEEYLENVFRKVSDLSSHSSELERYIKDWSSEYHLTVKRAQLFAGFDFTPSLKVLEVGCGCGAITRYLGETFNEVVSVEGSINRARLARLRTKDLGNVSILCAPFQEIEFTRKFDIIFCVGVYEYSASFVSGDDPYDTVLSYFSEMLTSNGIVVIAIENQFGLKYFSSSREDHTGTMFEGLEGYHTHGNAVKTFGKHELENKLKKYFSTIKFYYPFPDYKLPDCIISDDFLSGSSAGELVSQFKSRDYCGEMESLWDESLVTLELSRNGMLPFFSNSFLIFAGKSEIVGASFNQLAVMASPQRNYKFRTLTRVYTNVNGEVEVVKKALSGDKVVTVGKLNFVESHSVWKDSHSLQTIIYEKCKLHGADLESIFKPCKAWIEFLEGMSEFIGGDKYLSGEYIDCIWSNCFPDSVGITMIDKEWVWQEKIRMNIIILRSIFYFLYKLEKAPNLPKTLRMRNGKRLITLIAKNMGIDLKTEDFIDFLKLESNFLSIVFGSKQQRHAIVLGWLLLDRSSYYFVLKVRKATGKFNLRVKTLSARGYNLFLK